jgi:hypothetical protein
MKNVFLKCAGFGAGFAITVIAAIGLLAYINSLPRPEKQWNEDALTASFTEFSFNTGAENVAFNFSFALENRTDRDYSLPNDKESLFVALPDGKGLYKYNNSTDPYLQNIAVDSSIIPSHRRVIVTIHLVYLYTEWYPKADSQNKEKMMPYVKNRLATVDGFTFFDKDNRYQINFPNGWKTAKDRSAGEGHG